MVKIALDAGHGINTPGKRTPDDEREWSFNNKVLLACRARLNDYKNVSILRLDDPTGKTDVPLNTRTSKANNWGADVLVSIHHNANTGKWGNWGGVETYTQPGSQKASIDIAKIIQARIVKAMGLRDRGHKLSNLHMTRVSRMPAILTEGGFMDSTTDIHALRNDDKLILQGEAIADGLAEYFKLTLKNTVPPVASAPPIKGDTIMTETFKPTSYAIDKAIQDVLYRQARREDKPLSDDWRKKYVSGQLTVSDALGLLFVMIDRNQIPEKHNK